MFSRLSKWMTTSNARRKLGRKLGRKRGASATGYVLIVGLIAATAIGALTSVGTETKEQFKDVTYGIREAQGLDEVDGFAFTPSVDMYPQDAVLSEVVRITGGFIDPVRVRASDGEMRINGGSWGVEGELPTGGTLQLRTTAPEDWGQDKTVTVHVADKQATWQVFTQAAVYVWVTGEYEACTIDCGETTVSRAIHCERQQDGEIVADSECLAHTRPAETTACTGTPGFEQSCLITNGQGLETCNVNGTAFDACLVSVCDPGFTQDGNACLSNCLAATVDNYEVEAMVHNTTAQVVRNAIVNGGNQTFQAQAACSDGLITISNEALFETSCDAGYTLVNNVCYADCQAGVLEDYNYSLITHGNTLPVAKTVTILNGTQDYAATATCTDGVVALSNEALQGTSCSAGYSEVGNACFANCTPGTVSGYVHSDIVHLDTVAVTRSASVDGGTQTYTANASCNDGLVTVSGEALDSTACDTGYSLVGNTCHANCVGGTVSGYLHGPLNHDANAPVTRTEVVTGGTQIYAATASCADGVVTVSGEALDSTSCSSGYAQVGDACFAHCASGTVDGYSHVPMDHGDASTVSKTVSIDGGDQTYLATASCDDGAVTISDENLAQTSCDTGYTLVGVICFADCPAGSADGYAHGNITHNDSANVSKPISITGGTQTWAATASCSDGAVSISGEGFDSVSCDAAYVASGQNCSERCGVDEYWTGSACSPVGTGFYSAASNNSRTACSNKPANSAYIGSGGGSNNCTWACDLDYYKTGSSCAPVGNGYYSAASSDARVACSNKPANSDYTSDGNGANNCSWTCSSGYTQSGSTCFADCGAGASDGYSWGGMTHGQAITVSKQVSITGGTQTWEATATCTSGGVALSGSGAVSVSCSAGYAPSGNSCLEACGVDEYWTGSNCAAVGNGFYSTANNNSRTACSNAPANAAYNSDGNGANNCGWVCGTDFYQSGSSCAAVGTGYYSTSVSNARVACSNKPANSTYTSDGNGGNNCSWACGVDYYQSGSSCVTVGTGYYSPDVNNSRTACSNKPGNANYISDGNGSNSCAWACVTDFYLSGGSCLAVGTGYYSANNDNARVACSNKPANSNYTSDGNGGNSCAWSCATDFYKSGSSCVAVGVGYYSANNNDARVACSNKPTNASYTSDGNGANNCAWSCNAGYTGASCGESCGVDQYWNGSSCVAVGTGYWSANASNARNSCTNKPASSNYTSSGSGSNSCGWGCVTDYYNSGGTCVAVGTGYYSPNSDNNRTACSNKPASSNYTSDGNGANNCSWACVTDFYASGSSCVAVGTGYYSPNNNNSRTACSNKPSNSNYTSDGNGGNSCSWACTTDFYLSGSSCVAVGTGYYSANNNNSRVACTNKPANSNYTSDGNGGNSCGWACATDFYASGSSCLAVGTGYYSPNNNNARTACTNKPSNSNYTTDGNGGNACGWACITDFYQSGSSCAAVGTGYYSPNSNNTRYACSNKPANSSYTGDGNGANACPWGCNSGFSQSGSSCVSSFSCNVPAAGYTCTGSNNASLTINSGGATACRNWCDNYTNTKCCYFFTNYSNRDSGTCYRYTDGGRGAYNSANCANTGYQFCSMAGTCN